jgi:hypothetical protein
VGTVGSGVGNVLGNNTDESGHLIRKMLIIVSILL